MLRAGGLAATFLLCALLAGCSIDPGSRAPSATAGRQDLSRHDFQESPLAYLSGEWRYFPGELIDPTSIPEGGQLVSVPHTWNGEAGPEIESPGKGFGSYALLLELPRNAPPFGIGISSISSALRFYVNGELLVSGGSVSSDPANALPGYSPGIYPLPASAEPLTLVLHVSNFDHARGGFWEPAWVGSLDWLDEQADAKVSLTVLLASAVGTIGLYHLLLWSLRYRDETALTFALICALIALRALVVDDVYLLTLAEGISWNLLLRLEYLTLPGLAAFTWLFFGQQYSKEVTRPMVITAITPCVMYMALILFAPVDVFTGLLSAFHVLAAAFCIAGPVLVLRAVRNKREGAWAYFVCILIMCAFVLHDLLVARLNTLPILELAGGPFSLLPLGVTLVLLPQAVILAARTARSSRELEQHSRELMEARDRLDNYTRELESRVAERTAELEAANNQLARLARVDGLTGLGNRRHFDEQLAELWADHRRRASPLGLLLVDVDEFKHFNDTYGHQLGDDALRMVAQAMRESINRPRDELVRYGGDEMAALLPDTDLDGALIIAERMRAAVEEMDVPHLGANHTVVTISIGVAVTVPADDVVEGTLVEAADAALYQTKARGRNQVAAGEVS
jgi:diguanylate cyclase (GGDEF)-like protein